MSKTKYTELFSVAKQGSPTRLTTPGTSHNQIPGTLWFIHISEGTSRVTTTWLPYSAMQDGILSTASVHQTCFVSTWTYFDILNQTDIVNGPQIPLRWLHRDFHAMTITSRFAFYQLFCPLLARFFSNVSQADPEIESSRLSFHEKTC